jgi:DNA-binding response OmpR family regulator
MRVIDVPDLGSMERGHTLATISVVGLLGAGPAAALEAAGYDVSRDQSVEYTRLDHRDLLVLALAPPEPPSWAFVRALRQRSSVPVLALVPDLTTPERRRLREVGASGCLDHASSDAEVLAEVDTLLTRRGAAHSDMPAWPHAMAAHA